MRVERPRRPDGPLSPDRAQQLGLREHARRIAGEHAQQRELLRAEVEHVVAEVDRARRGVDLAGSRRAGARRRGAGRCGAASRRPGSAARGSENGLATTSSAPRSKARTRSSSSAPAAVTITGTPRSARQATPSLSRTWVSRSRPEWSSSATSMIARSGYAVSEPAQAFARAVRGDHVEAVGDEMVAEEGAGCVVVSRRRGWWSGLDWSCRPETRSGDVSSPPSPSWRDPLPSARADREPGAAYDGSRLVQVSARRRPLVTPGGERVARPAAARARGRRAERLAAVDRRRPFASW